jgi:hypothetical protein
MIEPFYQTFNTNLKIIFFEELVGNIDQVQSLYKFLEVSPDFKPPSLNNQINGTKITIDNSVDSKEVTEVLKAYYRSHISKLENFTHRKLEFWYD